MGYHANSDWQNRPLRSHQIYRNRSSNGTLTIDFAIA
jgi:hypothetical protein